MTNCLLKKDLIAHKIYSAWQFVEYTEKNISTVHYCADIINKIIEKMTMKTVRWQQDIAADFVYDITEDGKKVKRLSVTTENAPVYELRVAGEKVDPWFLFDKLLRDFFQYTMNTFDYISQIINLVEKPKWCGDGFMHEPKDTLIPDLITINEYNGQDWFIIFDAKYYLIQLERGRTLKGNPGVGDVVKQYMYQLAYRKFIADHHIAVVKNCFLMPTEGKEIINKGKAKMDMLSGLGLEDIQIRLIPADMLFSCYLSRKKIAVEKLEL